MESTGLGPIGKSSLLGHPGRLRHLREQIHPVVCLVLWFWLWRQARSLCPAEAERITERGGVERGEKCGCYAWELVEAMEKRRKRI